MPYRHAHWWILGLVPFIALAFWPSYLSILSTSPPSFHLHGITASLWLTLLAVQSWSIHHGHREFHKTSGLISLALFPIFLAGGATIFVGMAQRYVAAFSPFHAIWPPNLAFLDFVAVGGMAYFYYQALKYRHFVGKHSSWLLATAIFLLPPIFGRIAPIPLGLDMTNPESFAQMGPSFHYGNLVSALIAFAIAASDRRNSRPWVIAGLLTIAGSLLFEVPGGTDAWKAIYIHAADIPVLPMALAAALGGMAVGWAGWVAGKKPTAPTPGALPA
ncbi:MAG TPA: hypothetical protein VNJ05_04790 [Sphingomicrobium sp.]|nr:hypothetical protein [Sphingomicrobium sp.]